MIAVYRKSDIRPIHGIDRLLVLGVFFLLVGFQLVSHTALGQTALELAIDLAVVEVADKLVDDDSIQRLAILDLVADHQREVSDRLRTAIIGSQKYQLIDRQHLELLLNETNFQMSDIIDPKTAVRAGKIAGVEAVIYGRVQRRTDRRRYGQIAFSLCLVNVQTGQIIDAQDQVQTYDTSVSSRLASQIKTLGFVKMAIVALVLIGLAGSVWLLLAWRNRLSAAKQADRSHPDTVDDGAPNYNQDWTQAIQIQRPNAVECVIDLRQQTATIGRLEVVNRGPTLIPMGWRGKMSIKQGIDRRLTLSDTIVLPQIAPNLPTPIMPGTYQLPHSVSQSQDTWSLEFFLVDPEGREALIFESQSVSWRDKSGPLKEK